MCIKSKFQINYLFSEDQPSSNAEVSEDRRSAEIQNFKNYHSINVRLRELKHKLEVLGKELALQEGLYNDQNQDEV
jgi:outer membrane receptor for monomeric catechols